MFTNITEIIDIGPNTWQYVGIQNHAYIIPLQILIGGNLSDSITLSIPIQMHALFQYQQSVSIILSTIIPQYHRLDGKGRPGSSRVDQGLADRFLG